MRARFLGLLSLLLAGVAGFAVAQDGAAAKTLDSGKPGTLSVMEIKEFLAQRGVHAPYLPAAPRGFSESQVKEGVPADNPLTKAKVWLGKQLYFDARLSADGTVSCASCHHPSTGFSDLGPTSTGIKGQKGDRNSPTVINRLFSKEQFWDGRAASLEEQALGPIANPIEMGNTLEAAVKTVAGIEGYRLQFQAVFGEEVSKERLAQAIAAYERTVISGDSDWDLHDQAAAYADVDLDDEDLEAALKQKVKDTLAEAKKRPLSESAKRGAKLFTGKAACSLCHTGANFTDELYHNIGVGMKAKTPDLGRFKVSKKESDKGAFKTPGLRNIADNAPYMHDGSVKTLEEVVEFYDQGGEANTWLSERIKPLKLTKQEKADLVAFMKALSGKVEGTGIPKLP